MKPSVCWNARRKGNNGKAYRHRFMSSIVVTSLLFFVILFFAFNFFKINGSVQLDVEEEIKKIHKSGDRHKDIIENYLTMTNLMLSNDVVSSQGTIGYGKVHASFCEIDWDAQAKNPSTVAMFRDLEAASPKCRETVTSVTDLYALVQEAKAFDGFDEKTQTAKHKGIVYPPNGVVFHETRCGSTLFANLLAGSGTTEGHSRVFSESKPPLYAFQAFSSRASANEDIHSMLIRDVFYMMGRRPPPKEDDVDPTLFFKIQSVGVLNINQFTAAFPDVPWVFVYRDAVEIIQSHFKQRRKVAVCTRYQSLDRHMQPVTTMEVINESGKKLKSLTNTEYCAAHLGGLSMAALQEHDRTNGNSSRSSMGRFVEYTQMPDIVWKDILPNHFGIKSLPKDSILNMERITSVYSKGRGDKAHKEWKEDTTEKQESATDEVIQAAKLVGKAYNRMKKLSH